MKKSLYLLSLFVVLSLMGSNKVNAEVNEFSEQVNGDIYGQVRVVDDVDGDGSKDLVLVPQMGKYIFILLAVKKYLDHLIGLNRLMDLLQLA